MSMGWAALASVMHVVSGRHRDRAKDATYASWQRGKVLTCRMQDTPAPGPKIEIEMIQQLDIVLQQRAVILKAGRRTGSVGPRACSRWLGRVLEFRQPFASP